MQGILATLGFKFSVLRNPEFLLFSVPVVPASPVPRAPIILTEPLALRRGVLWITFYYEGPSVEGRSDWAFHSSS